MRTLRMAALFALAACMGLLPLAARTKVGETIDVRVGSPHPIGAESWQRELEFPGSTFVKLHLAKLALGPKDLLLVVDGTGKEIYRHEGSLAEGTWIPASLTQVVTLKIQAAKGSNPWGVEIDRVGYGFAPLAEAAAVPESICGNNDMQDAACYASDAGKTQAGEAVGRMLFQEGGGWYLCTGFLVSRYNHFLTCNHCISDQSGANTLEVWWMYQRPACGSGTAAYDSTSDGAYLVTTNYDLDYSLLAFSNDDPAQRYGYLTLSGAVPTVGETMWIAGYPGGQPKQFTVNSDMDGGLAKVDAVGLTGNVPGSDIGYYADTEGGSSGSPVMDDATNRVIALHHFGIAGSTCTSTDMNQGVEMAQILPEIQSYISQPSFGVTASASVDQGEAPLTVDFTAQPEQGTAPYTYDWDFGDGSAHASGPAVSHTYTQAGSFAVILTASDGQGLTATDNHLVITVSSPVIPPTIQSVHRLHEPFRLKVVGTLFQSGAKVLIDGVATPETTFKDAQKLIAKKGRALKAMLPRGQVVSIQVRNPDGGLSAPFSFKRPKYPADDPPALLTGKPKGGPPLRPENP